MKKNGAIFRKKEKNSGGIPKYNITFRMSQLVCLRRSGSDLLKEQSRKRKAVPASSISPVRKCRKLEQEYNAFQLQHLAAQSYIYGDFKSGEAWLNRLYKVTGNLDLVMRFKASLQENLVKDIVSSAEKMQKRMVLSKIIDDACKSKER